ncbi:hypothetical protein B0T25DRAFT_179510 [Lasiosphaeria hispida]|uniref:Secreted protein n=1 Tax=Lasiosphaeria hispida TaxID=260671 RepID=A0AAJ0MDL4_9PEZI|nr:hypothetical protein B0T25DRAFT_179510 [Lasiosphaeria hispida]
MGPAKWLRWLHWDLFALSNLPSAFCFRTREDDRHPQEPSLRGEWFAAPQRFREARTKKNSECRDEHSVWSPILNPLMDTQHNNAATGNIDLNAGRNDVF